MKAFSNKTHSNKKSFHVEWTTKLMLSLIKTFFIKDMDIICINRVHHFSLVYFMFIFYTKLISTKLINVTERVKSYYDRTWQMTVEWRNRLDACHSRELWHVALNLYSPVNQQQFINTKTASMWPYHASYTGQRIDTMMPTMKIWRRHHTPSCTQRDCTHSCAKQDFFGSTEQF